MYWVRRFTLLVVAFFIISFTLWAIPRYLDPTAPGPEKRARDRRWVDTSPYFWDRQACRWLSVCGLHHLRKDPASRGGYWDEPEDDDDKPGELRRRSDARSWESTTSSQSKRDSTNEPRRILKDIPQYVLDHAPLVHLYSGEEFWPSDIKEHVEHMTVIVDHKELNVTDHKWTLDNLAELNELEGRILLRSNDDVETRPPWLHSHHNLPLPFANGDLDDGGIPPPSAGSSHDPIKHHEGSTWWDVDAKHPLHRIADPENRKSERIPNLRKQAGTHRLQPRGHKPDADGYSSAPAVLVMVDKGSGIVDAFWFFFYSYNLGQTVLGIRFGNHVGDWEHCMVRFEHGQPRGVYFSEHDGGQAYAWSAVQKRGDRPVIYSAVGSHAMYSSPGDHPYVIPFGLLKDETDRGPLWDPALNNYAYHYDHAGQSVLSSLTVEAEDDKINRAPTSGADPGTLVPAASNPDAPTSWFHFRGYWGDYTYSLADPRQWRLFGQYHYVNGPFGPKYKDLRRSVMCQLWKCRITYDLDPTSTWY